MSENRRPLTTRRAPWAAALATWLVRHRITPNSISLASIVFAAVAAGALWAWSTVAQPWGSVLLIIAAVGIQLRLLCNMIDGMVAVEGGLGSPTGDLFNEIPDRIADSLILIAAGFGINSVMDSSGVASGGALLSSSFFPSGATMGWAAALAAMFTAYIRALGSALGRPGCFHGPMAKPHRMALLTVICIVAAITLGFSWSPTPWLLWAGLLIITLGSLLTCARRLAAIVRHVRSVEP